MRARPWFNPEEAALDGVFTIRTRDDAAGLREALAARPGRVLVVGAGFIGSEVASVCRELDLDVTVAERGEAPLVGALGGVIGRIAAEMHRDHGVDLRTGVSVTSLKGDANGHVRSATLSDGTTLDVDVVVAALGSIRNVEWLEGSGLAAGQWGVGCDAGCRAFDIHGVITDTVYVAGDVARAPHVLYEYQFLAMEHWDNAVLGAEVAAHNMVSFEPDYRPHLLLPGFWSGQFGVNIKSVGVPPFADEIVVTQGSVEDRRFVAAYGRRGRIVAAVTFNQGKWLEYYAGLIEKSAPFPPAPPGWDRPVDIDADAGRVPGPGRRAHGDARGRPDRPRPERAEGRVPASTPLTRPSGPARNRTAHNRKKSIMAVETPWQQALRNANRANPYPFYEELRKTPVSRQPDGTYVVSTYRELVQLLHDPRVSSDTRKRPGAVQAAGPLDGDDHHGGPVRARSWIAAG